MRRGALVLVMLTVAFVAPASAHACSCAPVDAREALKRSDGAVIGRLMEVAPLGRYRAAFRYRLKAVYKGRRRLHDGELLTITASADGASCGLPRREGRSYGIFLRRSGGRWSAGLCDVVFPREMREASGRAHPRGC